MEVILSTTELIKIATSHLEDRGFKVKSVSSNYENGSNYEYYGDPQNEKRREIKVKSFNGLKFYVE